MSAPTISGTGDSQLENASPAALPTGTRSAAIAPAAQPSANGVTSDAIENAPSTSSVSRPSAAPERSA